MGKKQHIGMRIASILISRIGTAVFVLAFFLIIISIAGYIWDLQWTGLPDPDPDDTKTRAKTFWDWLDLLIIPIVLAAGALWFKRFEAEIARTSESVRAQEAALETYFDRMSELLLDKENALLTSKPNSPQRDMASTRTLTVLRRLDVRRRNQVFNFLRDARLLGVKKRTVYTEDGLIKTIKEKDPISVFAGLNMGSMSLQSANLPLVDLSGVNLIRANLGRADLNRADLSRADLSGADLRWANLSRVDLSWANLSGADLRWANLNEANLSKANLSGANLSGANLSRANLVWANLRDADGLTCEQLTKAQSWEHTYRSEVLRCGAEKLYT